MITMQRENLAIEIYQKNKEGRASSPPHHHLCFSRTFYQKSLRNTVPSERVCWGGKWEKEKDFTAPCIVTTTKSQSHFDRDRRKLILNSRDVFWQLNIFQRDFPKVVTLVFSTACFYFFLFSSDLGDNWKWYRRKLNWNLMGSGRTQLRLGGLSLSSTSRQKCLNITTNYIVEKREKLTHYLYAMYC